MWLSKRVVNVTGLRDKNEAQQVHQHAIVWDLDGTLVDSGTDIAKAANIARQGAGLPLIPEDIAISYVGDGVVKLLERVLGHGVSSPVSEGEIQAGLARFNAHYDQHLLDQTDLYPGIREVLAALSERPLFLATNKPRRFTMAILEGLGLVGVFQKVVAGDDVPRRKPDPAHIYACIEGTSLLPSLLTVVGDSPNDILAARGMGARSVAVTYGLVPGARLAAEQPDVLVDNVEDLVPALGLED